MDKFNFRVTSKAAEYLREHVLRTKTGELFVLTIAPLSRQQKTLSVGDRDKKLSQQQLEAMAKEFQTSLSSPVTFEWVIGGMLKSRLPGEEFVTIDGIECFFPDEVKSVLNGRVLRLKRKKLVFDPDLDPPPSLFLRHPDNGQ